MKESQFKSMQGWFDQLNREMSSIKSDIVSIKATMVTRSDLDKFRDELDALHGLIHQVHRRIDHGLSDDDSDKRLYRLALERLDDRLKSLEGRL